MTCYPLFFLRPFLVTVVSLLAAPPPPSSPPPSWDLPFGLLSLGSVGKACLSMNEVVLLSGLSFFYCYLSLPIKFQAAV
jgi:hypothetical protein